MQFTALNDHEKPTAPGGGFLIPSAIDFGTWQIWLVCVLYLLIAAAALFAFLITAARKQGTFYRSSFLAVSFMFCLLRGVITIVDDDNWDKHIFWLYLLAEFLPVYLQFWTFSLLLLFVVKTLLILHDQEETIHRWTFYPLYHVVQGILLVLCIILSYVLTLSYQASNKDEWDRNATILVSTLYLFLAVFGSIYYYRLYRMIKATTASVSSQQQFEKYFFLIPLYLCIFFSRAIWNILYFCNANPLQSKISEWMRDGNRNAYSSAFLVFYFIFEIFPTACVVYYFAWRIILNFTGASSVPELGPSTPSYQSPLRPKLYDYGPDADTLFGYQPSNSEAHEPLYDQHTTVGSVEDHITPNGTLYFSSNHSHPRVPPQPDTRATREPDSDSESDGGVSPLHIHNVRRELQRHLESGRPLDPEDPALTATLYPTSQPY